MISTKTHLGIKTTLYCFAGCLWFLPDLVCFGVDWCGMDIKKTLQNCRVFQFSGVAVCLAGNYARRTWTFFALSDFELNLLAFIERCITSCFNLRVMDE